MIVPAKPLTEISQQAFRVFVRELGVADTIRFVNQFSTGHGNNTAERDQLIGDHSLDEIINEIKSRREPG